MEKAITEDIIIIGTAHISAKSVAEVKAAIEKHRPKAVAIELDERRFETLAEGRKKWESTPLTQLIHGRNAYFFMAQALLSSMQKRMGKEFGVEPGSEMLAAVEGAKGVGAKLVLADRDITITLQKAWRLMTFREKFRIWWEMMKLMVPTVEEEEEEGGKGDDKEAGGKKGEGTGEGTEGKGTEGDEGLTEEERKAKYDKFKKKLAGKGSLKEKLDFDEMMEDDILTAMMEELRVLAPTVAEVLIRERDIYISKRIVDAYEKHGKVVAVVGAGHVHGIEKYVKRALVKKKSLPTYKKLERVPPKGFDWLKAVGYSIPILFIALCVWLAYTARWDDILQVLVWWSLITGTCAMIGAIVAWGHPVSWVVAFLAAPIATLHPAIATGWFAGAAELWVRKPKNKDLLELMSGDYETFGQYYHNKVFKIIIVTAFTNLGAMVGTFIAGSKILTDICL